MTFTLSHQPLPLIRAKMYSIAESWCRRAGCYSPRPGFSAAVHEVPSLPTPGVGEVLPTSPGLPGVTSTGSLAQTPAPHQALRSRDTGSLLLTPPSPLPPAPAPLRSKLSTPLTAVIRSFRAAVFLFVRFPLPDQSEYTIRTAQRAGSTLISACSVHRQALTRLLEQSERSIQSLNYQNCQSGGTRVRVPGFAGHSSTGPRA